MAEQLLPQATGTGSSPEWYRFDTANSGVIDVVELVHSRRDAAC